MTPPDIPRPRRGGPHGADPRAPAVLTMAQATISLVAIAVLAARAVNVL